MPQHNLCWLTCLISPSSNSTPTGTATPWYTLHPVVREYLLTSPDRRHSAATCTSAPPPSMAHRLSRLHGKSWPKAAKHGLTKKSNNWPASDRRRRYVDHTRPKTWITPTGRWIALCNGSIISLQAGQVDAADDIVNAVIRCARPLGPARSGQGPLAPQHRHAGRHLNRAVAQGNLATLLQDEGRLAEALQVYEEVYQTFAAIRRQSSIWQQH